MPGAATSRTASLLTVLSVVAGITLLASATGGVRGPVTSAIAGGLLGVGVLLRAHERPVTTALSSVLVPFVALLGFAGLGLSVLDAGVLDALAGGRDPVGVLSSILGYLGVGIAATLGTFGAVGTLRDGIGDGAVARFWRSAIATLLVVVIGLGVVLVPRFDALSSLPIPSIDLSPVLDPVLAPVDPGIALVTIWLLLAAFVQSARLALDALPLVELAPRSRRDRIAETLERADGLLRVVVRACFLFGAVSLLVALIGLLPQLFAAETVVRDVVVALAAPGLRSILFTLVVAFAGIALLSFSVQRAAGRVTGTLRANLPAATGGLVVWLLAFPAAPLVGVALEELPAPARGPAGDVVEAATPAGVVLGVVALAVFLLTLVLALIVIAGAFQYIPSRAAGGALAAGGLVVGAIAVGATAESPLVVFSVVGLAILAWDASEHGVATRAELGATGTTSIEAVHAVGSLAVAILGISLAWILHANVIGAVAVSGGNLVGALSAIAGSLLLLGILRG